MKKIVYYYNKGFTLLEITATLMIIAIISGLASLSIVNYIDAYTLHKQHTEIAQQARLVINRLINEFVHITEMRSGRVDEIAFCSRFNNLKDTTISFQDNAIKINNVIFADNVSDFKLRYLTDVDVFDNIESHNMWKNQWTDSQSTSIQFDISFEIKPILLKRKRSYSISFTNITVVPRTLGALE
jgi:prepilin-type N-terminal cleavage/methylation domain-containing protein